MLKWQVLMLTLNAATTDVAMGFAGMFYLFWWQFRVRTLYP